MQWVVNTDEICKGPPLIDRTPTIESPCTKVCIIDPESQSCRGCFRSLHEIANWLQFSDAERRAVVQRVQKQQAPHPQPLSRRERGLNPKPFPLERGQYGESLLPREKDRMRGEQSRRLTIFRY